MSPRMPHVRIFVNERPVVVPATASVRQAIGLAESDLLEALEHGRAYVTDGVGRQIVDSAPVSVGAIYRVVVSARQSEDPLTTA
jgi:hypothetical protein